MATPGSSPSLPAGADSDLGVNDGAQVRHTTAHAAHPYSNPVNAPLPLDAAQRAERQRAVVAALSPLLPSHALLWTAEDTVPYECDGLTAYRQAPLVVALPETEEQVASVLKACHALAVPVVARGAGTGL